MTRSYHFVGEGAGIPGLPHEITDEQARDLGLGEMLRVAIAAGSYAEVKAERPKAKAAGDEGE